eukprot:GHVH01002655.1.p1 GENE.GHVH01002655.1~~GHVH01002655.1.p1  ORF type:complete len:203 (+),score=48.95 GHVH01002655.1:68-676(+)
MPIEIWQRAEAFGMQSCATTAACCAKPAACCAKPAECCAKPAECCAEDSDDFDLFGEETSADVAARDAMNSKMEAKKIDYSKAKAQKVVINKNSIVFDIIPGDSEQDFEKMAADVREIATEGLTWGESMKVVPMCFGLNKMQLVCTVLDSVDTELLVESVLLLKTTPELAKTRVEMREAGDEEDDENEYYIKSCDIVSFQKL